MKIDIQPSKVKVTYPIEYGDWHGRKCLILKRDWSKFNGKELPKTFKCPFCGKKHIHGGIPGHRVAHCGYPPHLSCIAEDGTILNSSDGYILVDINRD